MITGDDHGQLRHLLSFLCCVSTDNNWRIQFNQKNLYFSPLTPRSLQYRNEAGSDKPEEPATEKGDDDKSVFTISTYSTHHVKMDGITFYTEEFRIEHSNTKVS